MEEKKIIRIILAISLVFSLCYCIIGLVNGLPNFLSKTHPTEDYVKIIILVSSQITALYLLYKNNKYAGILGAIFPICLVLDVLPALEDSLLIVIIICVFYTAIYFKKEKK